MIIGVTGKSGVGKSTYAKSFAQEKNFYYLDVDEIGHQVLDDPEVQKKCLEEFGLKVSSTNRKKLGELIFANRLNMKKLSEFTWGKMQALIDKEIENHEDIIIDWILLPLTKYFALCNKKILITLDETKRRNRLKKRDGISEEEIILRDKASIKYDVAMFDEVIQN